MGQRLQNIGLVYSAWTYWAISAIAAVPLAYLFYYFTSIDVLIGNLGAAHAWAQVLLQAAMVPLFGLNIALVVYRFNLFREVGTKAHGATAVGTVFGSLVAGCPACSVTLASFLGLGAVISGLPFFGIELLVVGILLLGYSNWWLATNLTTCRVRKKR